MNRASAIRARLCAAALCGCMGCATAPSVQVPVSDAPPPAASAQPPAAQEPAAPGSGPAEARVEYIGEVVRVNAAEQYVVVRCKRLPSEGEEARVERKLWQKGRVRFTGPVRPPYAVADIKRGDIEPGDAVLR